MSNNRKFEQYQHYILKKETFDDFNEVEKLLCFAVAALGDVSAGYQHAMFTVCMMTYKCGFGQLHILAKGKHLYGFCFVLDKCDTGKGSYHIHLVAVVNSARKKGLGRHLIGLVMNVIGNEPVTLEAVPTSQFFFEKVGFNTKLELENGYKAMCANGDGSEEEFKTVAPRDEEYLRYGRRFNELVKILNI